MADLSITATSVVPGTASTDVVLQGIAGATITAGQPLYEDSTASNGLKPAVNSSVAAAAVKGIATCNAASGQPVTYQRRGDLTVNAVLTKGTGYFVSANAGGIAPQGDLSSGKFVTMLGIAISTTVLRIRIFDTGIAVT